MERRREDPNITAITARLDAIELLLEDVKELIVICESGFKVLGWIGTGAKWIASVGAALGFLWAFTKFSVAEMLLKIK